MPAWRCSAYGRGRSMVFAGEASWRWKMLQPSTDRSYEFFWRQALRWLTTEAPDPVSLTLTGRIPSPATRWSSASKPAIARFAPVADAVVEATLITPGGDQVPLPLRSLGNGRFDGHDVAGHRRSVPRARRGEARHDESWRGGALGERRRQRSRVCRSPPERRHAATPHP